MRREWIKPIMFSGGLGTMDANMSQKILPQKGMEVIKIGGPVYRIGVGAVQLVLLRCKVIINQN